MTSRRNVAFEVVGCVDVSCIVDDGSSGRKPGVSRMERGVLALRGKLTRGVRDRKGTENSLQRAAHDVQQHRGVQTRDVLRALHPTKVARDRGDGEG